MRMLERKLKDLYYKIALCNEHTCEKPRPGTDKATQWNSGKMVLESLLLNYVFLIFKSISFQNCLGVS